MRILVTGAGGQLGRELVRCNPGYHLSALRRSALDISDADAVAKCVGDMRPDVVVNAAAYTAVDGAESNRDAAFAANRDGPANLARMCELMGIPLVHVSTDYVFDGSKREPYTEDDPVAPLGVYGASKLAGEQAALDYCSRVVILRTSWVFSRYDGNFVTTMFRLGRERDCLGVVSDQRGCPTAAGELARAVYSVLDGYFSGMDDMWGVYHFCQPPAVTWHDFALALFDELRRIKVDLSVREVRRIRSDEYPSVVSRPANSVMDSTRFSRVFSFTIRPWRGSLREVVRDLERGVSEVEKEGSYCEKH